MAFRFSKRYCYKYTEGHLIFLTPASSDLKDLLEMQVKTHTEHSHAATSSSSSEPVILTVKTPLSVLQHKAGGRMTRI